MMNAIFSGVQCTAATPDRPRSRGRRRRSRPRSRRARRLRRRRSTRCWVSDMRRLIHCCDGTRPRKSFGRHGAAVSPWRCVRRARMKAVSPSQICVMRPGENADCARESVARVDFDCVQASRKAACQTLAWLKCRARGCKDLKNSMTSTDWRSQTARWRRRPPGRGGADSGRRARTPPSPRRPARRGCRRRDRGGPW